MLQPDGWLRPRGYSNGISATGRQIFVSGMIGWNESGTIVDPDLVSQTRQALGNIVRVLAVDGARAEHLVRLTWYITDRSEYHRCSKQLGVVYRDVIGPHYPAMSVVQVAALMEPRAVVEIEATAVVPV